MEVTVSSDHCNLEEKAIVHVGEKELHLSLLLQEDELAPFFSGQAWAGTVIWDAAMRLCNYLLKEHINDLKNSNLVELGCGIGVPGMVSALMGANVVLTEQKDLVRLLKQNIAINFSNAENITAEELSWAKDSAMKFKKDSSFDFIISCDCIYQPLYGDSWKNLALTIEELSDPTTTVLVAVERRNDDGVQDFLDFLSTDTHLKWSSVLKDGKIEIYRLQKC